MIYYNTISYRPDQDLYNKTVTIPKETDYVCIYCGGSYTTNSRTYNLYLPTMETTDRGKVLVIQLTSYYASNGTVVLKPVANQPVYQNGVAYQNTGRVFWLDGGEDYTLQTKLFLAYNSTYTVCWEAIQTGLLN